MEENKLKLTEDKLAPQILKLAGSVKVPVDFDEKKELDAYYKDKFGSLLNELRSNSDSAPSLEEITKE